MKLHSNQSHTVKCDDPTHYCKRDAARSWVGSCAIRVWQIKRCPPHLSGNEPLLCNAQPAIKHDKLKFHTYCTMSSNGFTHYRSTAMFSAYTVYN